MTHIGKVEIDRPVGQKALRAAPDMEIWIENIRSLGDKPWRFIFWGSGGNFEEYQEGLEIDPDISNYECLTKLPTRRLYRTVLSEQGQQNTVQSIAVEYDIIPISLTMTADRVQLLGRFPSRDAIVALKRACYERDRKFKLLNIYQERAAEADQTILNRYGVTKSQQEALVVALKQGYFEIPRQTRMENIADTLGISTSALSSRIRRGQKALLSNTLVEESTI
jgi:predicted DNA binding protein